MTEQQQGFLDMLKADVEALKQAHTAEMSDMVRVVIDTEIRITERIINAFIVLTSDTE